MTFTKEIRPLSSLKGWGKNPRAIKKDDFERLKRQIKAHGQFKPVLVTPDGEVIGGNMRLKAYKDLGISEVWVSVVEPKTDAEKVGIALADNDRAGYYVEEELAELLLATEGLVLDDYHLDLGKTLSAKDFADKFQPTIEDEFDVEAELPEEGESVSQLGDIYRLGNHRLMCGSSTDRDQTLALFEETVPGATLSDPPYGISVVKSGKLGQANYRAVQGDEDTQVALDFIALMDDMGIRDRIYWGGNYYANALPPSSCWVVWDKQAGKHVTFADCELAWTNFRKPVRMYTHRDSEQGEKRVHPTQKPIKLIADIVKDFLPNIQTIYDGFGGSGSTLIACEQLERKCYMMELDPRYVDVIIKRWEQLTGSKAEKLNV